MAKVLTDITVDNPTGAISVAPSDTFAFTGTPVLTGGGGVQRYDFKWEVDSGGGYVTIASSGTGLTTADTNPVINTNSQSANSITVTCTDAGTYTIRMVGAPTSGGSYTVISATRSVTVLNAYAITADSGSYTTSGQNATVLHTKVIDANAGSYSTTGQDATITYTPVAGGYTLTADVGTYVSRGQTANIYKSSLITANAGTYSHSGQNATIAKGKVLVTEHGVYTHTGQNAAINKGLNLIAETGVYSSSGQNATILKSNVLSALVGTYATSGINATISKTNILNASVGVYASTGRTATIQYSSIYPDPQYVLEGITYGPGGIYLGTLEALSKNVKLDLVTGKMIKPINDKVVMTL